MPDPMVGDAIQRRSLLATRPNPRQTLDYLVRLKALHPVAAATVEIFYVPDRLILEPAALPAYTATLGDLAWHPLEELAITILEDVSDEVVPRWARVIVTLDAPADAVGAHVVVVEDRQPNWSNDDLLARLRTV